MAAIGQARERILERELAQAVDQVLQILQRHLLAQGLLRAQRLGHQRMGRGQLQVTQADGSGGLCVSHKKKQME